MLPVYPELTSFSIGRDEAPDNQQQAVIGTVVGSIDRLSQPHRIINQ